jgi:hypothetical protein
MLDIKFGTGRIMIAICLAAMALVALAWPVEAGTTDPQGDFMVELEITPQEAFQNQDVNITVKLKNVAEVDGVYEAILKIDGVEEETKTARVGPNSQGSVEFTVSREMVGNYIIDVGGLQDSFTVIEGSAPSTFPTGAVIGGIAGVVVLGAIGFFVVKKRNG